MKKRLGRVIPPLLLCLVCVAALVIGAVYYRFISQRIYQDSTAHLDEIYSQVNRSFGAFVERNWGLLDGWSDYLLLSQETGQGDLDSFIAHKKGIWGFSEFYFLSGSETSMTVSGQRDDLVLEGDWASLTVDRQPIMAGERLPTGQEVTVFAVPVEHGSYKDFGYDAIAISYTNADLASSLNVDAFSGSARCFVIHTDGKVLLSTQSGGGVFANYLQYLRAVSDLDEDQIAALRADWERGGSGVINCAVAQESQFLLYQPIGYQDYILLSVVPERVVSAGFLSVQQITIYVLLALSLLIGATVITLLILRGRRISRSNRLALQSRELMFDVLSNSVDDIFLMLDVDNKRADYLSPNVERLLGIPTEEARGDLRVMEKCAINGDVLIPRAELEAIPLGGSIHRECEYRHQQTGERRWYRMTVYHLAVQELQKFIIVMSDRTQERQMNRNLQEALEAARSANEAKSNFLSNMSHDIRTPMNAIVGFSVLLEKDSDRPEKVREYTRKIMASSHHLLSLINDVLDMSKIESGKTSLNVDRFSLPEILSELNIILMPQAKAKQQTFTIHVQGAPPEYMLGDRLRLNQILINLLSNAIKYTPPEGQVDFTVQELPAPQPQYAKLRFVVRDNGIGMSEEFQKHVFAPFSREINSVTNKIQGTGLGMAITKNLVDLMGGVISVESAPGQGSTFTVELSFALPEEGAAGPLFRHRVTSLLVADNDEDICLDIKEMMRDTGVKVSYATGGQAAAEEALRAHRAGEDYSVILLDWKMPGFSGPETARLIRREIDHHVPILVLTSCDWGEIEEEARGAGIDAFVPKPFFPSTFWHALQPFYGDQDPEPAADDARASNVMEGRLFLIAEDNELNAEILTEMLEMEGASSELAVNGQEAVDKFLASPPGHYDMILMDVQMPIMNGYEATRAIRASDHPAAKTIPIAAMTANTFAEDVRDALASGMDGHLAKPIDMDAVRELVEKLLTRAPE